MINQYLAEEQEQREKEALNAKTDLKEDSGVSTCKSKKVAIAPQKEKIVEIVPEELTERGTQPHAVYLDGKFIGRIYYRKKDLYYAVPRGCYKSFNNLESAEEWLVDSYYSLEERSISAFPINYELI